MRKLNLLKLRYDPGIKDETVIITTAVDWAANTRYNIGDRIIVSGCVDSMMGKSWPRRVQRVLTFLGRKTPRIKNFVENRLLDLNELSVKLFDRSFGPRKWTIAKIVDRSSIQIV